MFLLDGNPITVSWEHADAGGDSAREEAVLIAEYGQVWRLSAWRVTGGGGGGAADGAILSPMPGRIIAVTVAAGDGITKGQKLLTLEAMKMEHNLLAPFDGTVVELNATEGGQVSEGALLVRIDKGKNA